MECELFNIQQINNKTMLGEDPVGFKINGVEIINDDGVVNAELGEKAVTELPDGATAELSNVDELPIYDAQSGLLKRFTVGEISDSGLLGGGGSVASLDDVGDVDAPAPTNGQMLAYNTSTSEWEAVDPVAASLPAFPYNFVEDSPTWFSNAPAAPTMADGDILLDTSDPDGEIVAVITANDINGVNRSAAIALGFSQAVVISLYYDGGFYRLTGFAFDAEPLYGPTWAGLLLVGADDELPTGTVPPAGTSVSLAVDISSLTTELFLTEIGDVDAPFPSNNDVLTYNSTTSEWEAQPAQTGSANQGGLQYTYSTNTDASNATNGQIRFNGTQTTFGININDRNGVSQANFFSSIATGLDYLIYIAFDGGACYFQGTYTDNVANAFRFTSGSFTGILPGANDNVEVTITPTATGSSSVALLDDIGNVSTSTVTANQVLVYDGSQWVADTITAIAANGNGALLTADWTNTGASNPFIGEFNSQGSIIRFNVRDDSNTNNTAVFNSISIGETVDITFSNGSSFTGTYSGISAGFNGNYAEFSGTFTGSFASFTTYTFTFTSQAGNVLIGNQTIDGSLEVKGDLDVTNGGIISGDGSGLTNVSDTRWKTGITTIGIGMSFIEQVNPIRFQYQRPVAGIDTVNSTPELTKWDYSEGWELRDDHWRFGFSAQELSSIEHSIGGPIGIAITDNPEQYQMRTEAMLPILVNAVKELKAELTSVQSKNVELEGRIAELENP